MRLNGASVQQRRTTFGKLGSGGWHLSPLYPKATSLQIPTFLLHTNCAVEVYERNHLEAHSRWSEVVLPHRADCPHAENGGNIYLSCQRSKPDELRSLSLVHVYCLTACTGQQGKQRRGSSWNDASTQGFWHPSAAGARGLFACLHSGAVSRQHALSCISELLKHYVLCLHLLQSSPDPALLLA